MALFFDRCTLLCSAPASLDIEAQQRLPCDSSAFLRLVPACRDARATALLAARGARLTDRARAPGPLLPRIPFAGPPRVMPSPRHEAPPLFCNRPTLAPELLGDSLGDLPGYEAIRLDACRSTVRVGHRPASHETRAGVGAEMPGAGGGSSECPAASPARASRGKSAAVILAVAAAIEAPARPPEDRVSKSTSVPFTYSAGAPPVVEVTAADGTKYVARMGSTVFEVLDTGETNPDGTPKFEFKVNLQFDVQRKSG